MKLKDKGPIVKAPILKGWAGRVSAEVQSWREIISATHWAIGNSTQVNGADFYVGEKELGHIHLDGEVHLALTKTLAALLINANLASPFPWGNGWVQLSITDEKSANLAIWLFQIGYDRLKGGNTDELKTRISEKGFTPLRTRTDVSKDKTNGLEK